MKATKVPGRIIYLVTSGEYSQYGVEGAFSSLKKAWAYLGRRTDGEIEPLRLNDDKSSLSIRRLWQVRMDKQGKVDGCFEFSLNWEGQNRRREPELWNGAVCFRVMAKTEKGAIKAANEQRTQLIALDRWPTKDGYLEKRDREG